MDILKPKLNKPLLYLFKLGIYTSLYGIIRYIVFRLPTDNADVYAFILTIAIIIFNRGKLTHILQQFIDRQFYRTFYNLKQELLKLNQELPSYMEPDELIQRIKTFLDHHFLPEDYRFYILKGDQFNQVHRSGESSNRFPARLNIESSGECWKALPSGTYMFSIDTLEAISPQCSEFIRSLGENNPYTYLVPLNGAKGMNGFILFSDKILALTQVEELRELLERVFQKTGQLLENALIHAAIKRKSLESEILLDIVGKITSSLNLQQVLESIVDNLSKLVQYDAAAIFLVDKERKILQQVVTRGYDEARMQTLTLKLDQGISGEVIRTQTGVIIPDVRKDPHYFAAREKTLSQITVPIVHRGNAIGALVLESDQLEHFTREDLELLTFFSGLAAIAIRNAQLYEDSVKKKRLESELVVASRVQKALLPRRVPVVQGIEMDFVNIPSLIVGGDFYDIFKINEQCQGIAIGDVSGKGAPAALLMAVVYAGFKSLLKEIDPVVTVVARLNNFLAEVTAPGYFVTFVYGILDMGKREFTYCNAGHNPPLLFRKEGTVQRLTEGGIVLGFLENRQYVQQTIQVQSGDYLCFYTDGVTEIKNPKEEEFGEKRLIRLIKKYYGMPPRELRRKILDSIQRFAGKRHLQDDLTLIIVKIE